MRQREQQHDVQTLESSPLDVLLDRPYLPSWSRQPVVIRRPQGLCPSRQQIVDYVFWRSQDQHGVGRYPDPECEIISDAIFIDCTVPTTGRLYFRCHFEGCDIEEPVGRWDMVDCNLIGHQQMVAWLLPVTQRKLFGGMFCGNLIKV